MAQIWSDFYGSRLTTDLSSMAKQTVSRKPAKKHIILDANSKNKKKRPKSNTQNGGNKISKGSASKVVLIVMIAVGIACIGAFYDTLLPVFVRDLSSKKTKNQQAKQKMEPGKIW